MKKIISTLFISIICISFAHAQAPGMFKYQTVVRNASGDILPSQLVKFRISLLKGSPTGTISFREEHTTATSQFGIVNLEIGNGSSQTGEIDTIQWGKADYFIEIELDPTGSSGYTVMGTTQLVSVPYALYSENANNAINDNDKSPTNELQTLSLTGNNLSISNGNSVSLQKIIAGKSGGGVIPSIISGTGFTITHVSLGVYNVTFTTPYTTLPTVIPFVEDLDYYVSNITVNGFRIQTGHGNTDPTLTDNAAFSFIVVGN